MLSSLPLAFARGGERRISKARQCTGIAGRKVLFRKAESCPSLFFDPDDLKVSSSAFQVFDVFPVRRMEQVNKQKNVVKKYFLL